MLDLVSTSRVKAWGPHTRRNKCEELASVTWPKMTNTLIENQDSHSVTCLSFSFWSGSAIFSWSCSGTGPIQPQALARHVHVPRRDPGKNSAGHLSVIVLGQLFSFFNDRSALPFPLSIARSAKPTLGRLLAMMDLRRHLARTAF